MNSSSPSRPVTTAGKSTALKQSWRTSEKGRTENIFGFAGGTNYSILLECKSSHRNCAAIRAQLCSSKTISKNRLWAGSGLGAGLLTPSLEGSWYHMGLTGDTVQPDILPGPDFNSKSWGGVRDWGEGWGVAGRLPKWERRNTPLSVKY